MVKQRNGWRMSWDVGKATGGFENELWHWWRDEKVGEWACSFSNLSISAATSLLILQPFCCFTYITAHSPTIPLLHQHHSSFSNPLLLLLHHRLFTYFTWRAAPVMNIVVSFFVLAQGKYLQPFLYLQWHSRKQQILPHPPTPFKYFCGKILLTRQTDYRKIFGAKRDEIIGEWRKLHNAGLHALYSSTNIIKLAILNREDWDGQDM